MKLNTIQLKRALDFEGSAVEAVTKLSRLSGEAALKKGEPVIVRYVETKTASDGTPIRKFRYMMVICVEPTTVSSSATLTILPSFDDLSDFASYVKSIVPSGSGGTGDFTGTLTASDLEYIFNDPSLEISGSTQAEFNLKLLNIINYINSRLTWEYI